MSIKQSPSPRQVNLREGINTVGFSLVLANLLVFLENRTVFGCQLGRLEVSDWVSSVRRQVNFAPKTSKFTSSQMFAHLIRSVENSLLIGSFCAR